MKNYANKIGYSDITPFEVIRVVSERMADVREMAFVELPWEKKFYVGGFVANLSNSEDQRWEIKSDIDLPITRIRLWVDGKWYDRNGDRYTLADEPRRFYDYNF